MLAKISWFTLPWSYIGLIYQGKIAILLHLMDSKSNGCFSTSGAEDG
jgi:hypothetical protein